MFFKRYEPTSIITLAILLLILPGILALLPAEEPKSILTSLLFSYSLYYSGLLLSITTYRISPVHPLAKYPGPWACKISKLWLVYITYHGRLHLYFKDLHDEYGPIVRVGEKL
jgi:hypothetical protein